MSIKTYKIIKIILLLSLIGLMIYNTFFKFTNPYIKEGISILLSLYIFYNIYLLFKNINLK